MDNFYFKAEGFEDLIAKVEKLANEEIVKTNKEVLKESGLLVQGKAKELSPISNNHMLSGKWKTKMHFRMTPPEHMKEVIPLKIKGGKRPCAIIGWQRNSDEDNSFYAKFIEYGTSRMPAIPFLQTALDSSETEINDIAKEKYTKLINETFNEVE